MFLALVCVYCKCAVCVCVLCQAGRRMYVCLQMLVGFNILIEQPKFLCNFNSLSIFTEPQCLKKEGNLFFK